MAKILVADDEPNILEVMVEILQDAGHDVTAVPDGQAAVAELEKGGYELALVDVMMPRLHGYHVASKVRGFKNPPKIVIVTSRDYEKDKNALEALGVNAYLPKPFSTKDLLEVVNTLLKKS